MNNMKDRFNKVEKIGKLTLSYLPGLCRWRMTGGKFGAHYINDQAEIRNNLWTPGERAKAHWFGYLYNNRI